MLIIAIKNIKIPFFPITWKNLHKYSKVIPNHISYRHIWFRWVDFSCTKCALERKRNI